MKRIGIIGAGGISQTHAQAVSELENAELCAVYGRNSEKTKQLAARYNAEPYSNLEDFLKHRAMDFVIIGSPSGLHAEQGTAASQRGLHVLVEKPLDVTTERGERLISACEQAQVKLGVCYQDRFAPDIIRLKDLVQSGKLGKLILVSGRVRWFRPSSYYSESEWRSSRTLAGGGALMSQAIHTVDSLLWIAGDITRVSANALTATHHIEVEDTLVSTIEFSGGALGTLEAATSVYPGSERQIEISGSSGSVLIEKDRITRCELATGETIEISSSKANGNLSASSPVISDVRGHKLLIQDFINAIDNNSSPCCDGRDGLRSVQVVEAMYGSAFYSNPKLTK